MSPPVTEQTTTAINAARPRGLLRNPAGVFDGDREQSAGSLQDFQTYHVPKEDVRTSTDVNAKPPMWHRGLAGNPPCVFDGDKDESAGFLRDFRIYRMLNEDVREMKVPYYRVLLALGYIRGSKSRKWVGDWVDEQLTALTNKVTGEMGTSGTDEQLWDDFVSAFESAFTSPTAEHDAKLELSTLKMGGGDLDTYIATFEHLARKAGFDLRSYFMGTSNMFVEGLPKGLKAEILQRVDEIPRTYTGWVTEARAVHRRGIRMRAELASIAREARK